jgi:hypothetical protein
VDLEVENALIGRDISRDGFAGPRAAVTVSAAPWGTSQAWGRLTGGSIAAAARLPPSSRSSFRLRLQDRCRSFRSAFGSI